jgi:transcription initiation factor TFIIB
LRGILRVYSVQSQWPTTAEHCPHASHGADLSVKDVGRCYKVILKELEASAALRRPMGTIHAADYMRRFCSHLGLNNTDMKVS